MHIVKHNLVFKDILQSRTSTDFCIVHHADSISCDIFDIQKWHLERGFIGVGYNYFVDKKGVKHQGRPEWASDADARGHNYDSLSICLEGRFTKEKLQDVQKESLVELMVNIKKKYPKIKFMRHSDVNNTTCPALDCWADILSDVEDKIRQNSCKNNTNLDKIEELKQHLGQLQSHFYALDGKLDRVVEHFDRKFNKLDLKIEE